jgi:hypothetical protein
MNLLRSSWFWFFAASFVYFSIALVGHCHRSAVVYRDTVTGCEYISNPDGGITPRLDRTGKQICGDPE